MTMLLLATAVLLLPNRSVRSRLRAMEVRRRPSVPVHVLAAVAAVAAAAIASPTAAIAAAIAIGTARLRLSRSRERHCRRDELVELTSGLEVVIGELGVGAHPAAACHSAAAENSLGLFGSAAAHARLGGSAADAVSAAGGRLAAETGRIGAVWRVAESHGLALATLLDAARSDLLGRRRFAQRTEAALAGARATATVLAALPILGVALGQMMGAAPISLLLGGGVGGILLVVGTALACAGLLWTDHITQAVAR